MRRAFALILTLTLALTAFSASAEVTEDIAGDGFVIMRNHEVSDSDKLKLAIDYPTFEGDDTELVDYLTQQITTPILALRRMEPMAAEAAYANGDTDTVRSGYFASLDFDGLLSVEATVSNTAAGSSITDTSFFWRIIDLNTQSSVTVNDLFTEDPATVEQTIRKTVYLQAADSSVLLDTITDADAVPMPDSYLIKTDFLRTMFAVGKLGAQAVVVDLPWDALALSPSALLGGSADAADNTGSTGTIDSTGTDSTGNAGSIGTAAQADGDTSAMAAADGAVNNTASTATPEAVAAQPTAAPQSVGSQSEATLNPNFSLAPVQTPTPMPLNGNDTLIADVLVHGLWKQLGSDGETYYQFTQDGKLLTITVSDYTLEDGTLVSGSIDGRVDIGSDSAFTLYAEDGTLKGYVLNRMGEAVAPEEFVTPSPTPVPTPTAAPTATPTVAPTPTLAPTVAPTPTIEPYMEALSKAPMLASLSDAQFARRSSLQVYSAPDEDAYRARNAQVTTDETVEIYGVTENRDWVLVSYEIGNGGRGRVGYIKTSTLADAENVAKLNFIAMEMTLTKKCKGTDDPLNAKGEIRSFKAGDTVTLLAFMDSEWAYIETTHEDKPCRLFIPQTALMED